MKHHLIWATALVISCAGTAFFTASILKASRENQPGPVTVIHAGNPDDGSAELRVCLAAEDRKLMSIKRDAGTEISPDSRWIAVADATGSNCTEFRLFSRLFGLDFIEVKIPDPWETLKRLLHNDCTGCDHRYVVPSLWTDNRTLEVRFNAHGDAGRFVDDAILLYDVESREWRGKRTPDRVTGNRE